MAHHAASLKSIRRDKMRRARNRSYRSELKTMTKKVLAAADLTTAEKLYREASSLLDKMARRRIIHPNKAANQKARLARYRNRFTAQAS
ncbi:MAG: 30S ribosomal protein S20 [candidate division KSB1 bacterium]|nr:30S ribosomal protein S20 [candidate division KSB1 bacterium]MDZ7273104.1 30S ribosomal protein S20 [candidate division KSB1 bacterium]MDZ7285206.1 30S ribosomal protein S20 [candidate division KSB1 bacterium]MDZ7298238.1 30S ribosomal protein S20 [candidate division KSB1 bacterium]MDZ7306740.1 30S ribosomal protein S20 [candidate division KSB1 bacterium]